MFRAQGAHEIDFAAQNHKNREHVSQFLFSQREKVSAWELSDVRVLRSQNTDCRKNEVFRQSRTGVARLRSFLHDFSTQMKHKCNISPPCVIFVTLAPVSLCEGIQGGIILTGQLLK